MKVRNKTVEEFVATESSPAPIVSKCRWYKKRSGAPGSNSGSRMTEKPSEVIVETQFVTVPFSQALITEVPAFPCRNLCVPSPLNRAFPLTSLVRQANSTKKLHSQSKKTWNNHKGCWFLHVNTLNRKSALKLL